MRVYINKIGMINALGASPQMIGKHLLANHAPGIQPYTALFSGKNTFVGRVEAPLPSIPSHLTTYDCKNNQLLAAAYANIANEVEHLKTQFGTKRIGIVLGTSTSGIAASEQAMRHYATYQAFPKTFDYTQQEPGSCAAFLSAYAGIHGIHYTISTACSSSGKAIAAGFRLITSGLCDAVIVGGSDSLCELTLNGFDALDLVSPERCNPFSVNRRGLNLGEGATLLVLSRNPAEISLCGIGETTDGYHISAPDPNGIAACNAVQQALNHAKLSASDIGYVNLHGTGTQKNDAAESVIMQRCFADMPPCTSTKPLTGHTLGAAAATELGLCWLLLSPDNPHQQLPAQVWDQTFDSLLAPMNIVTQPCHFHKPYMMSHSFAFGGSNISLIIGKRDVTS